MKMTFEKKSIPELVALHLMVRYLLLRSTADCLELLKSAFHIPMFSQEKFHYGLLLGLKIRQVAFLRAYLPQEDRIMLEINIWL